MNRRILSILSTCLCLMIMVSAFQAEARTKKLNSIVAVVNNDVITEQALHQRMALVKKQSQMEGRELPSDKQLKRQVLQHMIREKLQLQMADRLNIAISDDQLNEQLKAIAKRNQLDLVQFKAALEAKGIHYKRYRARMREQMVIQMLQQRAITPKIDISKSEVASFLKNYKKQPHADSEFHVADIVVPLPDNPTPEAVRQAKQQAARIDKQLEQGADFHQAAIAHSSGVHALQGGDLGWNHLAELPDVFTSYLIKMQPGDVAGPIKAPNGYHVIKLVDVRQSGQTIDKEKARKMLFKRAFNRQLGAWLQGLKNQAYISVKLDEKTS